MTLRITPARKELLQAIADGAVVERWPLGAGASYSEWDRGPGAQPRRYVRATGRVAELQKAELVELAPRSWSNYEPSKWSLTSLGMTALDAAGGTP